MRQQGTANKTENVSTTSAQVLNDRSGSLVRTQLIITNTSTSAVITIAKGDVLAVAGAGIVLQPKQTYIEGTDGGYMCWQGAVQVVADASGTVGVTESFEQA